MGKCEANYSRFSSTRFECEKSFKWIEFDLFHKCAWMVMTSLTIAICERGSSVDTRQNWTRKSQRFELFIEKNFNFDFLTFSHVSQLHVRNEWKCAQKSRIIYFLSWDFLQFVQSTSIFILIIFPLMLTLHI